MRALFLTFLMLNLAACQAKEAQPTQAPTPAAECKPKPQKFEIPVDDQKVVEGVMAATPVTQVSDLKAGGYIVLVRHTSRGSLEGEELWKADRASECIPGASLNEKGISEAKQLGSNLSKWGIPVGRVISSPACRCKETAMHSVGRIDEITSAVIYWPMRKPWDWEKHDKELLKVLSQQPKKGTNTFIFAHNNTIEALRIRGVPSAPVEMGGAIVLLAGGKAGFRYAGNLTAAQLLAP